MIQSLIKDFCLPETNIRLIFTACKVGQYFSLKDPIPLNLKSWVVYKFTCAGCNASYIGQTTRHLSVRMNEHLKADKNSHVYRHINDNENVICQLSNDQTSFQVIDSANSEYRLKIKEALCIRKQRPDLNAQIKSYKIRLTL